MRTRDIFKSLLAIAMVVMTLTAIHWAAGALGGAFIMAAMVGGIVAGKTVDTAEADTASDELLRPAISQKITRMNPSLTPLNTILNMIKPVQANAWTYKYYAVENRPFEDTVATTYTKQGDGSETASIEVTNIDMWQIHDTSLVQGSTGSDGKEVMLYIYDIDIDSSIIKVQAVNNNGSSTMLGKQVVPAIASATKLTRMAQGKNELDAQTSAYHILPDPTEQYMQIFMAQVEEGEYQSKHNKEVDFGFLDYARQMIYDFKATMELTALFGVKAKITDKKTGKIKYLTGGAQRYVASIVLRYGAGSSDRTITYDDLVDWHKSNFSANAGSTTKVVFGGSGFTASLLKLKSTQANQGDGDDVNVDYVVRRITGEETKVGYGIEFKKIKTNFGTWFYYYHPLLDKAGKTDWAIVLDLAHIEKAVFLPMRQREIDLKGSGQSLAKARVIEESSALVVRYPDTHAIIYPN
jgi:hypothetical protein